MRCSVAKLFTFFAMAISSLYAWSNGLKTVHATYIYHAPAEMSVEQARQTALHRAMSQALADEFGMLVSQSSVTSLTDADGQTTTRLTVNGQSEVRGEWLETIGEPKFDISFSNGLTIVKVEVKGKAREIDFSRPMFSAATLRGSEVTSDFNDGDAVYLKFEAPCAGFLAVYLADNLRGKVYRLLPYVLLPNKAVAVDGGRQYTFFNRNEASDPAVTDELELTSASPLELNDIYVLYSPLEFQLPPIENSSGYEVRSIPLNDFNKWLAASRIRNRDLQLKTIYITIKNVQK